LSIDQREFCETLRSVAVTNGAGMAAIGPGVPVRALYGHASSFGRACAPSPGKVVPPAARGAPVGGPHHSSRSGDGAPSLGMGAWGVPLESPVLRPRSPSSGRGAPSSGIDAQLAAPRTAVSGKSYSASNGGRYHSPKIGGRSRSPSSGGRAPSSGMDASSAAKNAPAGGEPHCPSSGAHALAPDMDGRKSGLDTPWSGPHAGCERAPPFGMGGCAEAPDRGPPTAAHRGKSTPAVRHMTRVSEEPGELIVPLDAGKLPLLDGSYDWVRKSNGPMERSLRQDSAHMTIMATRKRGYTLDGKRTSLNDVQAMLSGTRFIRACDVTNIIAARGSSKPGTKNVDGPVWSAHAMGLAMQVAVQLTNVGCQVGLVNAASAYQVGGGFFVGGRHALEESLCMQTTLFNSLLAAKDKAKSEGVYASAHANPRHPAHADAWQCHMPEDGVVLSPHVEVMRRGTYEGYPFLEHPVRLAAIVSVAMPNCNARMRDAPVDRPLQDDVYFKLLEQKFGAMFAAGQHAGAEVLVIPDIGCGVYENDPSIVGRIMGEVLLADFPFAFREIHLVGNRAFVRSALAAGRQGAEPSAAPQRDGAK